MEYWGQCRVTARPPRFVWTIGWDERYRELAVQYDVTELICLPSQSVDSGFESLAGHGPPSVRTVAAVIA